MELIEAKKVWEGGLGSVNLHVDLPEHPQLKKSTSKYLDLHLYSVLIQK